MIDHDINIRFSAETTELTKSFADVSAQSRRVASTISSSFRQAIFSGKSLSDIVKNLGLNLSRIAIDASIRPLEKAIGGIFGGALGGIFANAKGNVFQQGHLVPFAKGGILSNPTLFSLAGNKLGLAGEAGPEAIMPLVRGSDGRLGVRAETSAAGPAITINIATPDIESFRRSQSQIAAAIANAAAQGQRNL